MANSSARMLLKKGKSFPQLLRSRLVGQPNVNICIKEQQFFQSLINSTDKIFKQKPILVDGFNLVDFVLAKDQVLHMEQRNSSAVEAARGRRVVSDDDEKFDDEEIEDSEEEFEDFVDSEDDDDDDDDDEDGDGDGRGRGRGRGRTVRV